MLDTVFIIFHHRITDGAQVSGYGHGRYVFKRTGETQEGGDERAGWFGQLKKRNKSKIDKSNFLYFLYAQSARC
ncbi:hypothetical protein BHG07_08370 [Brenneria salicis ATCC 15712 = DSM 30166]|nr:hypothetical protein BHG07_08370 [Brenneria salicis ATCC 15712 = DSM 30166]